MSRFCSQSHHVQSTSMSSESQSGGDSNGGHCASPYLRRFRIPKLNTFRHHLEEDEDDDEWFEMQMSKTDLIRLRMNEMKKNRLKDRTNNNNSPNCKSVGNSKSLPPIQPSKKQGGKERSNDVESRNGNRCPAADEEEDSEAICETQMPMRSLWLHPKHLFGFAPAAKTAASSEN